MMRPKQIALLPLSRDEISISALPPYELNCGDLNGGFRALHFKDSQRESIHQQMIRISETFADSSEEEKDNFFNYILAMTFGSITQNNKKSKLSIEEDIFQLTQTTLNSNPLTVYIPGVTENILSFLYPFETVILTGVSNTFRNIYWTNIRSLKYSELILGLPWQNCPSQIRRLVFAKFTGLHTIRIEPVISSLLTADDLEYLLLQSSTTLVRLYICTPCSVLLLNGPSFNLDAVQQTTQESAQLDQSETDLILKRFACPANFNKPGCHSYMYLNSRPPNIVLSKLLHLELTGSDAYLWAMTFSYWTLPHLESVTLQTWSSDFSEFSSEETPGVETSECQFCVDSNCINRRSRNRLNYFKEFMSKLGEHITEIEFVVPGGLSDEDLKISAAAEKCSSGPSHAGDENGIDRPPIFFQSVKHQLEEMHEFLRFLLFDSSFKKLKKIEFIGNMNFTGAVYVLKGALTSNYLREKQLFCEAASTDMIHSDDELSIEETKGQVNRKNELLEYFLRPPINELGQPYLPTLNFEDQIDRQFVEEFDADEGNGPWWPDVQGPSLCRAIIVFSGVVQFPQKSCIELSVTYPDCIIESQCMSLLESHAPAAGYDPLRKAPEEEDMVDVVDQQLLINKKQKQHHSILKLRVQQDNGRIPGREFQRLQCLMLASRGKYLQPKAKASLKGKSMRRKRVILTKMEAPQDVNVLLKQFSHAVRALEVGAVLLRDNFFFQIFLGDAIAAVCQLSSLNFSMIETIRLVNWNGWNKSHRTFLNNISAVPSRPVHLTIETTETHYCLLRQKRPFDFYKSLARFIITLRSKGLLVNRLSLFPGPEENQSGFFSYFYPAYRLHSAVPPLRFISPFNYQIPRCLFTIYLADPNKDIIGRWCSVVSETSTVDTLDSLNKNVLNSTDDQEMKDDDDDDRDQQQYEDGDQNYFPAAAAAAAADRPIIMINDLVTPAAAPLQRGYTTIRELLVQEVENRGNLIGSDASESKLSVAWRGLKELTEESIPNNSETLDHSLEVAHHFFKKGHFFDIHEKDESILTISSHVELADFYQIIIGLRSVGFCPITIKPFSKCLIIMEYDFRRFGELENDLNGDWFLETIVLPWLTLIEIFRFLTQCSLILLNVPNTTPAIDDFLKNLKRSSIGITFKRHQNYLVFQIVNPLVWSSNLCQWTLESANHRLGRYSTDILKRRVT